MPRGCGTFDTFRATITFIRYRSIRSIIIGSSATTTKRRPISNAPGWTSGIAFSRFPAGATIQDCSAPGIWTIDPDGSHVRPVISRAPEELASNDLFGLQPLAWLDDDHILTGIRTNAGMMGAVVDTRTHRLRKLDDFANDGQTDAGAFVVGGEALEHAEKTRLSLGRDADAVVFDGNSR